MYTEILAREVMEQCPEYGLTECDCRLFRSVSGVHDIGKLTIPDSVLFKPGKLTQSEYEILKRHSVEGSDILRIALSEEQSYLKRCCEIARHHHERYDGNGYPDGLRGDEIPIGAQIISVADVFDALTSKRCYKDPVEPKKALSMIFNGECGAFNPKLLNCLKNKEDELIEAASQE